MIPFEVGQVWQLHTGNSKGQLRTIVKIDGDNIFSTERGERPSDGPVLRRCAKLIKPRTARKVCALGSCENVGLTRVNKDGLIVLCDTHNLEFEPQVKVSDVRIWDMPERLPKKEGPKLMRDEGIESDCF